ncbi:MAG TPA: NAD(+)/NADH kinase [Myxococcota bacterium]|nr:NAD(+)/NADH kinase [Myxococcota bacterium]HRY93817.1 NAD(+)/NADH kinase [Myxococcota bacterium]
MTRRLAILGGSFSPPTAYHRRAAEALAAEFDEVVVVPCGPRPDKPETEDVPPVHRAAMVDMCFRGLPRVRVELFDLEASTFTRTHLLDERFRPEGEVWHALEAEALAGAGRGESRVQRRWEQGARLLREARFVVLHPPGAPPAEADRPPHHRLLPVARPATAAELRERIVSRQPLAGLVVEEVGRYLERHGLYRSTHPPRTTRLQLDELRPRVVFDEHNPAARDLAAALPPDAGEAANLVVVVGGDGTMLRAIRAEWRRRLPFYGLNAGHLGFLLNERPPAQGSALGLTIEHLPLLHVLVERADGSQDQALAFNDAWVERASGQTAWLEIRVGGRVRVERLVADGALIASAAGSTSYARAMGAAPLPMNTPALLLVGSNVLRPEVFRPAILPLEAEVELRTLDPDKRPLKGFIDGVPQGEVRALRARISRIAGVELAFAPEHDAAEKLARVQFPLKA